MGIGEIRQIVQTSIARAEAQEGEDKVRLQEHADTYQARAMLIAELSFLLSPGVRSVTIYDSSFMPGVEISVISKKGDEWTSGPCLSESAALRAFLAYAETLLEAATTGTNR